MTNVVIVDAVRTPVGRRGGGLSSVHPADLLATVQSDLVARSERCLERDDIARLDDRDRLDVRMPAVVAVHGRLVSASGVMLRSTDRLVRGLNRLWR